MFARARWYILPLCFGLVLRACTAPAQTAASAPPQQPAAAQQLSPGAAYGDALHPLELTRHNIANWSDTELAAMNVTIARAKDACLARHTADFTGHDLIDLARLCSLGQQWTTVVDAASRYIAAPTDPKPFLTDALIAQTEAYLRLKQEPAALASELALLHAVPYTPDVADCTDEVLAYMRFVHTADALTVATARQPLLLTALGSPFTGSVTPTPSSQSPYSLYADGLLLPTLLQLAAKPAEAQLALNDLEAALPATGLTADDNLRIAAARRQYALLGKPLSGITPLTSLSSPSNKLPQLPARNTITALLLFPDWCAACIHLVPHLPETVFKVEGHSAYAFALLAQTVPPRQPDPRVANAAFNPAYAAAFLAETPTVTVPADTLLRFPAEDYPLLLLTDSRGLLRVLQPMAAQDLQPGGDLDAAIALVGRNFSPSPAANSRSAAPSTPHLSAPNHPRALLS